MMCAPDHFPEIVSIYQDLYYMPNQCILVNIAMPMFIFISGYLFEFLLQRGKYPTWGNLVKKKCMRLLLPYLIFSLFFMCITNNWNFSLLYAGVYGHLWFLPMLFWCFTVGYPISKKCMSIQAEIPLLCLFFVGTITPMFIPNLLGIRYISYWFYWFYLGMLVWKYRDFFLGNMRETKSNRWLFAVYLMLFFLSFAIVCMFPVEYGDNNYKWYNKLAVTVSLISIINLMGSIDWNKYKITPFLVKLSKYSFGIYIYHGVGPFLISNTAKQIFGLESLAANYIYIFPFCLSLITLVIALMLSWITMKTKIGRFLIG